MLKSTVPTCAISAVVASDSASMRKTSLSGRRNGTSADQSRPSSSVHLAPSHRTMRPVAGGGHGSLEHVRPGAGVLELDGTGGGSPPFAVTSCSVTVVVWLPEWNAAA